MCENRILIIDLLCLFPNLNAGINFWKDFKNEQDNLFKLLPFCDLDTSCLARRGRIVITSFSELLRRLYTSSNNKSWTLNPFTSKSSSPTERRPEYLLVLLSINRETNIPVKKKYFWIIEHKKINLVLDNYEKKYVLL
jgi:hypothetical protein